MDRPRSPVGSPHATHTRLSIEPGPGAVPARPGCGRVLDPGPNKMALQRLTAFRSRKSRFSGIIQQEP
jgi:hypothetical protein